MNLHNRTLVRRSGLFAAGWACAWGLVASVHFAGCQSGTSEDDIRESVVYSLADVRGAILERDSADPEHALLIDPRAPKYFAAGHLPGAVNIRLPDVREDEPRDPELERYDRLIVYGQNPGTAVARAMFKRLLAVGYAGVKLYAGGVDEWLVSGGELATSPPPVDEDAESIADLFGELDGQEGATGPGDPNTDGQSDR